MKEGLPEHQTLVLAGAFNPAILTPQWVAKHALGYSDKQEFRVELMTPVAGIGGMPRYSFDGVSYEPNFQTLTFFVGGRAIEQRQLAATVAARILGELPHTPVSGVGFNFGFTVKANEALFELLKPSPAVDAFGEEAKVLALQWGNVIGWKGATVTAQCELRNDAATLTFNFHHDVSSSKAAAEVLSRQDAYKEHYDVARAFAQAITKENLETT